MENNLVSIIMPLYNAELYIVKTIESVLRQTYKNWELVIVNDCSTDSSLEIVNNYKNNSKIKVFTLDKNGGSAVARNFALKNASGRFITFLDADDILDDNYLEEQVSFLISKDAAIVSSGYRRMASKTTTDFFVPDLVDYKLLLKGNPLSCLSTMYDKDKIGCRYFPENLRKCEDYVFWLDILKEGFIALGNHKVLATYRIFEASKSHNKFKLVKYMFNVYYKTQGIGFIKSFFCVLRWSLYGIRKYRGVR